MTDTSTPACLLKLDAQGALGAVRSLGRLGVEVSGVNASSRTPAARSRYCRRILEWDVDDAPGEETAARLVTFARTHEQPPVLVATDDAGALLIDDHAEALREAFVLPAQPRGLAHELYSKEGMYRLCKRLDVPTPETDFPQSRADVEAFLERAAFPVVVKPIDAWKLHRRGGHMRIVADAAELLAAYDELEDPEDPNLMLQEYIPGTPESVWMFNGYFDSDSRCLVAFTGRKLRQYPPATGMTSLGIVLRNDDVIRETESLMAKVGYSGVVDIGWRFDARDGRYKLLDVNPRLGNTFRLFVAPNGIDVLRALYLDLTGQEVPAVDARDGRKWVMESFDAASVASSLRGGALGPRDWISSYRGVEERAYAAADDPLPFAVMAGRTLGSVARRLRRHARPSRSPNDS